MFIITKGVDKGKLLSGIKSMKSWGADDDRSGQSQKCEEGGSVRVHFVRVPRLIHQQDIMVRE